MFANPRGVRPPESPADPSAVRTPLERSYRAAAWVCVAGGGAALALSPARAPFWVVPGLLLALRPLARAWRAARGTALRSAVVWFGVAVGLGLLAEVLAALEPLAGGRPAAGHAAYLGVLAVLAGLTSVLNARSPGGGAWAILTALLVLVFLIPWLEGAGLARTAGGLARLRLDNPWTIFYALLVVAGVTNYLPTRYGPAAALLGLGFVLEYLGLTRAVSSPRGLATVWTAVPWTLSTALLVAEARARTAGPDRGRLESLWAWFRDHWGVVWGLRVMERFNRAAESNGWPFRLTWAGPVPTAGVAGGVPDDAEPVLRGLLRRFATAERLAAAAAGTRVPPCDPGKPAR